MSKHMTTCPTCQAHAHTRNHYFTGKLMVERDFTDEQHYFMEKIRLHHQRLHGSGVVCGLQITAHDNPACRERYVVLQPGSAVDCCGKDIIVVEPEVLDLYALPVFQELQAAGDDETHTLQWCIRYRECPFEEIPVLYDECGCDDSQCAPNRILESYSIDLIVDPDLPTDTFLQPNIEWNATINIAHAVRVSLHATTRRLYVLTGDDQGTLYQVSTDNLTIETSFALNRQGLDLAVAPDGNQLYVSVAHADGLDQGDAELWVFDTGTASSLSAGPVRDASVADSMNSAVSLVVVPDGRLAALIHTGGRVRYWDAGVPNPSDMPTEHTADIGVDLRDLAVAQDDVTIYMAEPGSANVHYIDLNSNGLNPQVLNLAEGEAHAVSVVISTGPERIVVGDQTNQTLRLVDPTAGGVIESAVPLDYPPVEMVVSSGGHWAYVLENDGTDCYVQAVNLQRMRQGDAIVPGQPVMVGTSAETLHLTDAGNRLFVPYPDDLTVDDAGGVAVLDVSEQDCAGLLWRIDDCPGCDRSDCLVLATVENYHFGDKLEDLTDPRPAPADDAAASIARIDNRLGRTLLPSTQTLAEALACMLENCCDGGMGSQGPPGTPGKDGVDGTDGKDGVDGTDGRDGRDGVDGTDGRDGVDGTDGRDGVDGTDGEGLEIELVRIDAVSWYHNRSHNPLVPILNEEDEEIGRGIVIGFTKQVKTETVDASHVFQVLVQPNPEQGIKLGFLCRCALTGGRVVPVVFEKDDEHHIDKAHLVSDLNAIGIAYIIDPNTEMGKKLYSQAEIELWITLYGDFVLDEHNRAIDAEFARAEFPTGDHPADSLYGVQGGVFHSWFTVGKKEG